MMLGHARKLQHFMCAGSQSESCRLRAHVLSVALGVCVHEEGETARDRAWMCMCVYVRVHARIGVRGCAFSVHLRA
jgi:hypothetical protein